MPNEVKRTFLHDVIAKYGQLRKLERSDSLFELPDGSARIYVRYSRLHGGDTTWYGLRAEDLQRLEGHRSVICFLWDSQSEPLLIPYSEYEDVFAASTPASDGQYKVQVLLQNNGTELYVARAGRFNVEAHFGWVALENLIDSTTHQPLPDLSHSQVQTLLGAIGAMKGYDVWVPPVDRSRLDWTLASAYPLRETVSQGLNDVRGIIEEVDVVWVQRGSNKLTALYEVEHSTPIYSALLRFNDIHLVDPGFHPRFAVVANDVRRATFARQLGRPTFAASGLHEYCTFLEYANVYDWHRRLQSAYRSNLTAPIAQESLGR